MDFKTQCILDHLRSMLIFNAQELSMNSELDPQLTRVYIVQYFFGNISLMYLSYGNFWTLVKTMQNLGTLVPLLLFFYSI